MTNRNDEIAARLARASAVTQLDPVKPKPDGRTLSTHRSRANILIDPESASTKRIAWAFGCAKKDSDEERALYNLLVERIEKLRAEREQHEQTEKP